jgi:hypothetical protein
VLLQLQNKNDHGPLFGAGYNFKEDKVPSKTKAQARFFAACAHGAGYKSCPSKKIAAEFNKADAGTGILKGKRKKRK